MPIPLLGQMWYVAAALVHQPNAGRFSSAHRGRSQGCYTPGRADLRMVSRFYPARGYFAEACGGLFPCRVISQASESVNSGQKLTEVIEAISHLILERKRERRCSRARILFLKGRCAERSRCQGLSAPSTLWSSDFSAKHTTRTTAPTSKTSYPVSYIFSSVYNGY